MSDASPRERTRTSDEAANASSVSQSNGNTTVEPYSPPMQLTREEETEFDIAQCSIAWPGFRHLALYLTNDTEDINLKNAVNLVRNTSYDAYASSNIGWDSFRKLREFKTEGMRIIVMKQHPEDGLDELEKAHLIWYEPDGGKHSEVPRYGIAGIVNYLPVVEVDPNANPPTSFPALYIYELHLIASLRGQGVGQKLIDLMEEIATDTGHKKLMLTVFMSNTRAIAFYTRLGFTKWDEEAVEKPKRRKLRSGIRGAHVPRAPSYIIMAKDVESIEQIRARLEREDNRTDDAISM